MNNKRRLHDIDPETEERKITTLDILDDYPFLSKQIQAAVSLRNNPIQIDQKLIGACKNDKKQWLFLSVIW